MGFSSLRRATSCLGCSASREQAAEPAAQQGPRTRALLSCRIPQDPPIGYKDPSHTDHPLTCRPGTQLQFLSPPNPTPLPTTTARPAAGQPLALPGQALEASGAHPPLPCFSVSSLEPPAAPLWLSLS